MKWMVFTLVLLTHSLACSEGGSRSGLLEVENGSIYYETAGDGPAPIVFIHGGFGDRRMWDAQFKTFASKNEVVRYDHRGYGKSSKADSAYSPVADLLKLLDHLSIERAVVVGNSMGGTLAIDFTLLHPERVAALVVVASGPDGIRMSQADRDEMMKAFDAAKSQGVEAAIDAWLANPMVVVTSRDPRTKDRLRTIVTENSGLFFLEHWPYEGLEPTAVERLGEIKTPTLIVVGDRDIQFVQQVAETAAKGITGAKKVVIPGADHLPQMITPDEFDQALAEFLSARAVTGR